MLKFTEDHEWLLLEDATVSVGITKHAAEELGDIVFVELPEVGQTVAEDDEIVTIESTKAAADIRAPMSGEITEINQALVENPALVNEDPMAAWFFRMKPDDASMMDDLMDEDAYAEHVG